MDHYQRAIEESDKALALTSGKSKDNEELGYRSATLEVKSHAVDGLGRRKDVIPLLEEAIEIDERRTDAEYGQVAASCVSLAGLLLGLNDVPKAVRYCDRANLMSMKKSPLFARLAIIAGTVYEAAFPAEIEKSKKLLLRAKSVLADLKEEPPNRLNTACRLLGLAYVQGDKNFEKAFEHFEGGWKAAYDYGLKRCGLEEIFLIAFYGSMTASKLCLEKPNQAHLELFEKWRHRTLWPTAMLLDEGDTNFHVAEAYVKSALLDYSRHWKLDKLVTLERAKKALEILEAQQIEIVSAGVAAWLIGMLLAQSPKWPHAEEDVSCRRACRHLKKAVSAYESTNSVKTPYYATARGFLGEARLAKGDRANAAEDFKTAQSVLSALYGEDNPEAMRFRNLYDASLGEEI
jgi:tetratricopeptide (TPR) repeat protein